METSRIHFLINKILINIIYNDIIYFYFEATHIIYGNWFKNEKKNIFYLMKFKGFKLQKMVIGEGYVVPIIWRL